MTREAVRAGRRLGSPAIPIPIDAASVMGALAGSGIPLLIGNALIYAGAAMRAPKPKI